MVTMNLVTLCFAAKFQPLCSTKRPRQHQRSRPRRKRAGKTKTRALRKQPILTRRKRSRKSSESQKNWPWPGRSDSNGSCGITTTSRGRARTRSRSSSWRRRIMKRKCPVRWRPSRRRQLQVRRRIKRKKYKYLLPFCASRRQWRDSNPQSQVYEPCFQPLCYRDSNNIFWSTDSWVDWRLVNCHSAKENVHQRFHEWVRL